MGSFLNLFSHPTQNNRNLTAKWVRSLPNKTLEQSYSYILYRIIYIIIYSYYMTYEYDMINTCKLELRCLLQASASHKTTSPSQKVHSYPGGQIVVPESSRKYLAVSFLPFRTTGLDIYIEWLYILYKSKRNSTVSGIIMYHL